MDDAPALLIEWAHGWSVSRGARRPVPVEGGVRIDAARPAGTSRYVLPAFDPVSESRLGRAATVPGTEIKTLAPAAELRAYLDGGWSMYDRNELMVWTYAHRPVAVPDPYSLRVVDERAADESAAVVVAEARDRDGAVVSTGRFARWGDHGIIDRVWTADRCRRSGLATAVLTSLANRAVAEGLRTGVLSASEEGALLYRRLGWEARGEIAGAVRDGRS